METFSTLLVDRPIKVDNPKRQLAETSKDRNVDTPYQ